MSGHKTDPAKTVWSVRRGSSDPRKDHEDYARTQELFSKCELMDIVVCIVLISL